MILVMDVGNTNIKLALCTEEDIVMSWRVSVKNSRTADELGIELSSLLQSKGYSFKDISGVIISSVVPSLNYTLHHAITFYIGVEPIIVNATLNTGITIKYTNPLSLGADRIANAVGAYYTYGPSCIIVDLGTATTCGAVNSNGEFIGGCIAPGIKTAADALSEQASQLPLVELKRPDKVISTDTIGNIQSGIVIGFRGLVRELVNSMKKELNDPNVKVIATGGLTELIRDSSFIDIYDRALTLKGLLKLYSLNAK